MADWLRRLLYPLVLPTIVATVWLCGWVRQQDDRMFRDHWTIPPLKESRLLWTSWGNSHDAEEEDDAARPARPNAPGHDFFAAASADDDAVDEP